MGLYELFEALFPCSPRHESKIGSETLASTGNILARRLFAGVASGYDFWAEMFSLLQYSHWRRVLLATLRPWPGEHILDVSTGTGAVALDLARAGCKVTGLDISRAMLTEGVRRARAGRLVDSIRFVEGSAEALPFRSQTFDAVSFTFLLRYVNDPQETMREIARVVSPGGRVSMLEFGVPTPIVAHWLWSLYVHLLMPGIGKLAPGGWPELSVFLGPNILNFICRHPVEKIARHWREAGLIDVHFYPLSFGGAFVMTGRKPV